MHTSSHLLATGCIHTQHHHTPVCRGGSHAAYMASSLLYPTTSRGTRDAIMVQPLETIWGFLHVDDTIVPLLFSLAFHGDREGKYGRVTHTTPCREVQTLKQLLGTEGILSPLRGEALGESYFRCHPDLHGGMPPQLSGKMQTPAILTGYDENNYILFASIAPTQRFLPYSRLFAPSSHILQAICGVPLKGAPLVTTWWMANLTITPLGPILRCKCVVLHIGDPNPVCLSWTPSHGMNAHAILQATPPPPACSTTP